MFMTKPDTPTNVQVARYNGNQMNLTWTKGTGAHYTIIERNSSTYTTWNIGEGIQIYNDSGNNYEDIGLSADTRYYYQLWSYTSAKEQHQYSSNYVSLYTDGTPAGLLADSEFNDNTDDDDIRIDSTNIQDWYESRNDDPTLLTLDTSNIYGNN